MKTLTIRGLPDEVHARLKGRAKQNRRSLNQEVIAELGALVDVSLDSVEAQRAARVELLLSKVEDFRKGLKGCLTTEEISSAIKEGRR